MRKINLLFLLMLSLMGITRSWAQETLTVNDGTTTNMRVPISGANMSDYTGIGSEVVIPAASITDMKECKIKGIQYYSSSDAAAWNADVKVYLKEVSYTTQSTASGETGATVVYNGKFNLANGTVDITFDTEYEYKGGNLLIGLINTSKGAYISANFYGVSATSGSSIRKATGSGSWTKESFLPKMTFTYESTAVEGPGFKLQSISAGETLAFGLVNPSTTKTITIKNPGTEDNTVAIATTGGFTTEASVVVPAGETVDVAVAAPTAFGAATGTIVFTPAVGEAATVNLTATILDPSKLFETFAGGTPEYEWETTGASSSWTSYNWTYGDGYATYSGTSSSYAGTMKSPVLTFTEGEILSFSTSKVGSSSYYTPSVSVQWSATGADDWTTLATYTDDVYGTWTSRSVNVPATAKYIRFSGWYFNITNIYGGTPSQAPIMAVTAEDYNFGLIAEPKTMTFNIKNKGKSELTGIQVTSDNAAFTVSDAPATLAAGAEADVTVTMGVESLGAQTGVIKVEAPEQTTVTFNVGGSVLDNTLFTETFDNDPTARNWEKSGTWTFTAGKAVSGYGSSNYLITPDLTIAEGDVMTIEATGRYSYATLTVKGSKDGGEWTTLKTFSASEMGYNEDGENMQVVYLTDVPAGNYKLRFEGYYAVLGTVNGYHLNANAPSMQVTPDEDVAFGKVVSTVSKTYTVANVGTGELTVNIASDNDKFVVNPAQLVITDEAKTFTVTFTPEEGVYGSYEANITLTPTYNEELVKTIKATAKTVDPSVWSEDFESGATQESLVADGWEISDGWTIGVVANDADNTTTQIHVSTDYDSSYRSFVTPRLEAAAGDVLSFRSYYRWGDERIKVSYSEDKSTWTEIESVSIDFGGTANNYKSREMSFEAPMAGKFYLKFEGHYGAGFDDFYGFKLATVAEHEFQFTNTDIPATGTQFVEYTAKVTVKNSGMNDDEATVKAYIGDDVVYTDTKNIAAGEEEEFVFSFEPQQAYVDALIHFEVENENIETLVGETVTVNIASAVVLDEENKLDEMPTGTQASVLLKFTPKTGWNTICVPFALTDDIMKQIFGEGYKVYELKGYNNGELKFNVATTLYGRCPYIVYAETPAASAEGIKLQNVSFSSLSTPNADQYGEAKLQGTYEKINMQGKYGVVPSTGHIKVGGPNATLKGYRAYFELPEGTEASGISLDFGDGTVITGIEAVELLNGTSDVYDLNGRKMDNSSLQRGVYVINGKKVVIK